MAGRLSLVLLGFAVQCVDSSPYSADVALTPIQMQKVMGLGINLGNRLDLENNKKLKDIEESWFDGFKQANFTNVRIPVHWDKYISKTAPYTVDPDFLKTVEKIVNYALTRDMVAILNTHHEKWIDSAAVGVFERKLPRLEALWKQISQHFSGKSEKLLFEIFNEAHLITPDQLNRMNAACLNIIRESNPTRIVLLQGLKFGNPSWIISNGSSLVIPDDKQLMLEVHNYDPFDYAGGNLTVFSWGSSTDRAALQKWVTELDAWSKRKGLPIYYGEFGTTTAQTKATGMLAWYAAHYEAISANGWAASVWNDGNKHLLFDYDSGVWTTDILKALDRNVPSRMQHVLV
jgi:endoglucanase